MCTLNCSTMACDMGGGALKSYSLNSVVQSCVIGVATDTVLIKGKDLKERNQNLLVMFSIISVTNSNLNSKKIIKCHNKT